MITVLQGDGAKVILMTPNRPRKDFKKWRYERTRTYVKAAREVAKDTGVTLVGVWDAYTKYDSVPGQDLDYLLLDDIHPNDNGQALVAELLVEVIAKGL